VSPTDISTNIDTSADLRATNTVRSENRRALSRWYIDLVVSIKVAIEVCCCFIMVCGLHTFYKYTVTFRTHCSMRTDRCQEVTLVNNEYTSMLRTASISTDFCVKRNLHQVEVVAIYRIASEADCQQMVIQLGP
jgi:hypothetical protein